MRITADKLCQLLNGSLEGNPDIEVNEPSKIEEGRPGSISFLANLKYEPYAYTTGASVLLVPKDWQPSQPVPATLIRVDDVYSSISLLLEKFGQRDSEINRSSEEVYIHPSAKIGAGVILGAYSVIEEGVQIGTETIIYPQVYIGRNARIGRGVILYPGVKIYRDCVVGDQCILHANAVIGSDGFGFAPQEDGSYRKIPQLGNVILEAQVEIGANTVIDRATMGSTIIRKGAKLDNLIQIAHNVEIGSHTAIAAQTGIAGSTKVGENVQIGGQAGLVGHLKIADKVKIQAQSGVTHNVKENTAVYGSPALAYKDYLKSYAIFRRLPDIANQLRKLERRLKALEEEE